MKYSNTCLEYFLANQRQLFDENVAETKEEADEFLDECMAEVVSSVKDVRKWLDGMGMDVSGLTDAEICAQAEVFPLPDGKYLIVEA